MYEIGGRIRMYREQRGLSQKKFASLIGAKNTAVSNWEKGYTRPDVDTLARICGVLDVSADDMLNIRFAPEDLNEKEKKIVMAYRAKTEIQHAVNILLGIE
jgi:transcriptional regulator with XRE-family HTH domain